MPAKVRTPVVWPKLVDLTAGFPKPMDKALVKVKGIQARPMGAVEPMVAGVWKAMPATALPMDRPIFPIICSEVLELVVETGTLVVPVGVRSNSLLMETVCLPSAERSKPMGGMLPAMTTVQVEGVPVVPFVWKVVPSWHLAPWKPRVETA